MIEFKPYIHHGVELERAVLGVCMLEKSAFARTIGLLEEKHLYSDGNKTVYRFMLEMYNKSIPLDIFTVTEWLTRSGFIQVQNYNAAYYVTRLTNEVVSSANLEYHCHLIREMWQRREIINLKYSHIDDETDPRKNISDLNIEIAKILGSDYKREWSDMSQLMYDLMIHQTEMAKGDRSFITTGFKRADRLNGGFYNGQMIVIGARPSVGKSALMGQMALSMARSGKKVGIVSLEMSNNEIAARLSAIETGIDFGRVYRDIATDEALHRRFYDQISRDFINLPIYLSDKTKVNIGEIKAKAWKLKSSHGCDCLMIDYLQLVDTSSDNRSYNREQQVAEMSRGIKLMAHELDIPIIVLCQLNRQVTARSYKDRFPKLSDLRESGAIEQDADVVIFLHRDYMSGWQVDEQNNSTEFKADLLATKWRNGATFHLEIDFDPLKMKFTESTSGFVPVSQTSGYHDDNPF